MKIFQSSMGKSKSLPKAKLYPCLLALCDEQITDLSMRVTMLANPDTACRVDVQGKGGNGSGGSSGGSGSGAVKLTPPTKTGEAVVAAAQSGKAATEPRHKTLLLKNVLFALVFIL
jgi:hypothetical protein